MFSNDSVLRVDKLWNIPITPQMVGVSYGSTLVLADSNSLTFLSCVSLLSCKVSSGIQSLGWGTINQIVAVDHNFIPNGDKDLYVGTSQGLYIVDFETQNPIKTDVNGSTQCVAYSASKGEVACGTAEAVYTFDGVEWNYEWVGGLVDSQPFAVHYDQNDKLWIGYQEAISWVQLDGTYDRVGGFVQSPGSVVGGLPYGNVTNIVSDLNGIVWIGTTMGVSSFNTNTNEWRYFFGYRFLPGNYTYSLAVDNSNMVYVVMEQGIGILHYEKWTLQQKADWYQSLVEPRHDRFGFVSYCILQKFGALSSYEKVADESDGLWTSIYLGAQAFRYAVTKDPAVKAHAWRVYEAMEMLSNVTGIPGLMARTIVPSSQNPQGSNWHNSTTYPEWAWMSGTSSDDVTGHMFAYPLVYHLVAETSEEKLRVSTLISNIMNYIVDNGFYLIDYNGKPTKWGVWAPQQLNSYDWLDERGLNSLQILSYLVSAYNITNESKFMDAYSVLVNEYGYSRNIKNTRITTVSDTNYSDDELGFLAYHPYIHATSDPKILKDMLIGLARAYKNVKIEKGSFFNFIYASAGFPNFNASDSIWDLQRWPLEQIDWPVPNSHRIDYRKNPEAAFDDRVKLGSVEVLPPDERALIRWNGGPFNMNGGTGYSEMDPGTWLLPYWMGRFYGYL